MLNNVTYLGLLENNQDVMIFFMFSDVSLALCLYQSKHGLCIPSSAALIEGISCRERACNKGDQGAVEAKYELS